MSTAIRVENELRHLIVYETGVQSELFTNAGDAIETDAIQIRCHDIPRYVGEFWTSKQRQAASISEISYRACFKPQLPRFFIELLTRQK